MEDKKTLITIIVLLVILLPLTVYGTYRHFTHENTDLGENPNHELIFNDKVYFYLNDELLSTYNCNNCAKTLTTIDDTEYHTNYFQNGTYERPAVLNPNVALINENGTDYAYSISSGLILSEFAALKDYKIEHTTPIIIANDGNKWGVLSITNDALLIRIAYQYDYIAIPSHIIDGKLDTSKMIAKKENEWYILNNDGTTTNHPFSTEIVDFNDYYYVAYDGEYHIYDYYNLEFLNEIEKKNAYATEEYILIIDNNNKLYIYDNCENPAIKTIDLPTYETIYFNQVEAGVEIMLDGNLYQTIEQA